MPRLHESLNEKQSAECSINLYAECDQVNVHVPLSTTAKIRLDLLHTQQHNAAPLRSALCALRSALCEICVCHFGEKIPCVTE